MSDSISNNKRIAKNTLYLYFRMIFILGVGLYTSRVVLNTLGVIDFGIYNVVGGVVTMLLFLNTAMSTGTQRFITYELGRGDIIALKNVFSASVIIHVLVAITIFIIAETIGLWFVYNKMVIPDDRLTAALWVYQCSVLTTMVAVVSVPYNALIIAEERMSAFAYISILEVVLKLIIVYFLLVVNSDKLVTYAVLLLIVQVGIRFCYSIYCQKHFPESKFIFIRDKKLFKKMSTFSLWSLNGCLALACASQGIGILLNLFYGPAINAAQGIASQVQTRVYSFCTNFQLAAHPQIIKLYASNNLDELHKLIITSSKFSFYLMLILSVPLMVNISPILRLWLGVVPSYTAEFVVVMLFASMIRTLAFAITTSIHATGNIKRYQLWEGSILLMVLPIAYIVLLYFDRNPVYVVVVYLIVEIIAQIARVWIVLPVISFGYSKYLSKVLLPIMYVCSFLFIMYTNLNAFITNDGIIDIVIRIFLSMTIICISIYLLGLDSYEKRIVIGYIKKYFVIVKK